MTDEYSRSRDLGKDMGRLCSKILITTGRYYSIALSSITSAYNGFTEETEIALNSLKSTNTLDECVDVELNSTDNLDEDAEEVLGSPQSKSI